MNNISNIVVYNDGELELKVSVNEETIWLTQKQIAEIFEVNIPAISKHIKNIYKDNELNQFSTVSILEIVQTILPTSARWSIDTLSMKLFKGISMTQQTFGQKAVGLSFNPSGDDAVSDCKQRFATAIDQMNDLRNSASSPEVKRMASVTITELQTAQMWAVKALTWKD